MSCLMFTGHLSGIIGQMFNDQNIFQFNISMDYASRMQKVNSRSNLMSDIPGNIFCYFELSTAQKFKEVTSFFICICLTNQIHNYIKIFFIFEIVDHLNQVRMSFQRLQNFDFSSLKFLLIDRHLRFFNNLDGYLLASVFNPSLTNYAKLTLAYNTLLKILYYLF